jgi:hypothetical protein
MDAFAGKSSKTGRFDYDDADKGSKYAALDEYWQSTLSLISIRGRESRETCILQKITLLAAQQGVLFRYIFVNNIMHNFVHIHIFMVCFF